MTTTPCLVHHLLRPREGDAERIALIDGERSISYHAFSALVARCAATLLANGLSRGDRVAIVLPKSIEECWAIFGVSRAAGVFVPVNNVLRAAQIRHIVEDSGARIVICSRAQFDATSAALAGLDHLTVLCAEAIADGSAAPAAGLRDDEAIGEDLAAILYTSGSTGKPKGVMLSHRNLLAGSRIVINYLEITERDRILSILPFSFDYGLNQLLTAVQQRAVTVLFTFQLGDEIVRAIRDHAITGLAGVPTIWAILTKTSPLLRKTRLPTLRYITNSGGAVPSETVKRLRELLGDTRIFLMYGLTEAFRSTYLPPEEIDRRPTSIGKAIPECEVFAVKPDGQRARPGEPGILVHRGPTVSLGYWNRPEDTAAVLRQHPFRPAAQGGEIVCYSGDLVVEDEDGFFSFVGRADAMIKSSGYRISPTEVEEVLMATGAFRQVAVIGLPDPLAGQKVHAIAVPLNGAATRVHDILQTVSGQLPAFMVPRMIELVDALPTTPNGKLDYPLLARQRGKHAAA
ncbi:AMP-binding protein [Bradyrhizobium sediminis]|uniref:AMP-binding protein n=1 Tax=Bradyrhizobium sediminis TaxID=2840469 RepID=A0A975NWL9_9BRAD|nr:AMP-binding protein [Bradyrhizobium sediminis]QWG22733.1 AMP-binding protein [Bradyrhizobium sediminis]